MASKVDVVEKFAKRQINPRTHDTSYQGGNIYCEGNVIYSYGRHFPMAIFLGTENLGTPEERHLFLKNGDKYSGSTSGHQSAVQRYCYGPTISRTAVAAAGISFANLFISPTKTYTPHEDWNKNVDALENYGRILFYRPDFRKVVYRENATGKLFNGDPSYRGTEDGLATVFQQPEQGMFVPYNGNDGRAPDDPYVYGVWHILGATVIEQQGNYYLCSLDENSYFVSQLPRKPKSIEDALESLKPKPVVDAEKAGKQVIRQGEWFFINTGVNDRPLSQALGLTYGEFQEQTERRALPTRESPDRNSGEGLRRGNVTGQQNLHEAILFTPDKKVVLDGGKVVIKAGHVLARGDVYHRTPTGTLTHQHKTLHLGEFWHQVYRNTEIAAWSQGGNFD